MIWLWYEISRVCCEIKALLKPVNFPEQIVKNDKKATDMLLKAHDLLSDALSLKTDFPLDWRESIVNAQLKLLRCMQLMHWKKQILKKN